MAFPLPRRIFAAVTATRPSDRSLASMMYHFRDTSLALAEKVFIKFFRKERETYDQQQPMSTGFSVAARTGCDVQTRDLHIHCRRQDTRRVRELKDVDPESLCPVKQHSNGLTGSDGKPCGRTRGNASAI